MIAMSDIYRQLPNILEGSVFHWPSQESDGFYVLPPVPDSERLSIARGRQRAMDGHLEQVSPRRGVQFDRMANRKRRDVVEMIRARVFELGHLTSPHYEVNTATMTSDSTDFRTPNTRGTTSGLSTGTGLISTAVQCPIEQMFEGHVLIKICDLPVVARATV